jgi:hypothetical protein
MSVRRAPNRTFVSSVRRRLAAVGRSVVGDHDLHLDAAEVDGGHALDHFVDRLFFVVDGNDHGQRMGRGGATIRQRTGRALIGAAVVAAACAAIVLLTSSRGSAPPPR